MKRPKATASKTVRLRWEVVKRDGAFCKACGSTDDLTLDHIRPRSKGGTDALANLQILCQPCNNAKGDSWEDPAVTTGGKDRIVKHTRGQIPDFPRDRPTVADVQALVDEWVAAGEERGEIRIRLRDRQQRLAEPDTQLVADRSGPSLTCPGYREA